MKRKNNLINMEELEKSLLINELFDIYGCLLSSTQQKMIDLYYTKDLSLSEISSQENVSRNAVFDALKKGVESLNKYEEKLKILSKLESLKNKVDEKTYYEILKIFKEDN